jgi:glucan phosphoethanolaminetransferase (alkaline phosphatase superfamily)
MYLIPLEASSLSWPDAAAFIVLVIVSLVLIGIATAAFVQLRKSKITASQEDDLRQLIRRYEHLAENTLDAQQRVAADVSELRSRTASIEQMLRTVE